VGREGLENKLLLGNFELLDAEDEVGSV